MSKVIQVHLNKDKQFSENDVKKVFAYIDKNIGNKLKGDTYLKKSKTDISRKYTIGFGSYESRIYVSYRKYYRFGDKTEFEFNFNGADRYSNFSRILSSKKPDRIKEICEEMVDAFNKFADQELEKIKEEENKTNKAKAKIEELGVKINCPRFSHDDKHATVLLGKKSIYLHTETWTNKSCGSIEIRYVKKNEIQKVLNAIKKLNLTPVPQDKEKD